MPLTWFVLAGPAAADSEMQAIKARIVERLPGAVVDHVAPTPIAGIYEVGVDGGDIVYVSADGRYLLSGSLVDLETKENLTDRVLAVQRVNALAGIPEAGMIIFEPDGEVKHTLTTFTDIDCAYCRKMHSEMALLRGYAFDTCCSRAPASTRDPMRKPYPYGALETSKPS
jgi:thiol:disulfide interchange protein DsbC